MSLENGSINLKCGAAVATGEGEFQFGPFRLDGARRSLTCDGVPVRIGGRALEVLSVLAAAAGKTVERSTLFAEAWQGRTVEDGNLQVQISALRKALGEGWIVTIPNRGYRLTTADAAPTSDRTGKSQSSSSVLWERPSIAVLAFTGTDDDPDQASLASAIAEDVVTELVRVRWLCVKAWNLSLERTTDHLDRGSIVRRYGARYLLQGNVRREGNRISVIAHLIEAETANHIWAERFNRTVTDIFAAQDEIASGIIAAVLPAISFTEQRRVMRERSESLDPWEAYQRGLWHLARPTAAHFAYARKSFQLATKGDPTFAPPYYRLAHLLILECAVYQRRSIQQTVSLAGPLVSRAMELDPDEADVHAVTSSVAAWRGDWKSALASAERSVRMNPNSVAARRALGFCLLNFQEPSDAQQEFLRCLQINPRDPLSWLIRLQLGIAYYTGRHYELAADTLSQASATSPGDPEAQFCLAAALGQLDREPEARATLAQATILGPKRVPTIVPRRRAEDLEHLLDGLRRVGWRG
jgi:adenylate cyclase